MKVQFYSHMSLSVKARLHYASCLLHVATQASKPEARVGASDPSQTFIFNPVFQKLSFYIIDSIYTFRFSPNAPHQYISNLSDNFY